MPPLVAAGVAVLVVAGEDPAAQSVDVALLGCYLSYIQVLPNKCCLCLVFTLLCVMVLLVVAVVLHVSALCVCVVIIAACGSHVLRWFCCLPLWLSLCVACSCCFPFPNMVVFLLMVN